MTVHEQLQPINDMFIKAYNDGVECPDNFFRKYFDLLLAATLLEENIKQSAKAEGKL